MVARSRLLNENLKPRPTMQEDLPEIQASAALPENRAALEVFARGLLAMEGGLDGIVEAAQSSPGCPSLQLYAALFFLYAGTLEGIQSARPWLRRAKPLLTQANAREQRLYAAAISWADNNIETAMEALESIIREWPEDLVALKACEYLYYLGGQHHHGQRFLNQMERVAPHHAQNADVLAMHAFALELNAHYERARAKAEAAIDRRPACAWAHHALAHAATVTGDLDRGLREQEHFRSTWTKPGASIHGHNAWHLALLRLASGNGAGALALFRTIIWGHMPSAPGEQVDAISLLWRLEMAGHPVEDTLWSEVAEASEPLSGEALNPFVTAHHAHVFARVGADEAVERVQAAVQEAGEAQPAGRRAVWKRTGHPVVEAAIAWGRRQPEIVIENLESVVDQIPEVGGSDAQDDLFRLTLVRAYCALGKQDSAHQLLAHFPGTRAFPDLI